MFWISAFPTVAWKVASGWRFKQENRTTWWSSHRCRIICVYIISIYIFFCVRARGTAFSHRLWPQCPNSGHARRGCTLLGLVWSSTSTTTRAHSPPWHRRLRAKRSRLRQFVKWLCLQPSLSTRQCLRGARAVTFLSGHHSLPISIHYRLGLQPWLVNQSKALRCHGIILDCQIQTIQEKQWRPRRARQGGSKLPLLRSHAVVSTSGSSSAGALPPEVVSLLQSLASRDPNTAARLDGALPDPDKEKFAFETTPNQQCPEMPTNGVDAADFHQDTNCI